MVPFSKVTLLAAIVLALTAGPVAADPDAWKYAWPNTDFTKHSVRFRSILSGGPPRDGIPPIDNPVFEPVASVQNLADTEPVIGVRVNGEARAYPLQILMWHEIVNDTVGGTPISVTFCPLCNTAVVFDRRVDGRVLDFGTTGKLRNSDLIMYDRQTESWWQQFLGEGIVGEMTGVKLDVLPARIESFARFRGRAPKGEVLVPNDREMRRYGYNPYAGYDTRKRPYPFFLGELPANIAPLARVVTIKEQEEAWSLDLVRNHGTMRVLDDIIITWEPGQNSALGGAIIADAHDVGNVLVQRQTADGVIDVPYRVDFAFAFRAFYPDAPIHIE